MAALLGPRLLPHHGNSRQSGGGGDPTLAGQARGVRGCQRLGMSRRYSLPAVDKLESLLELLNIAKIG